MNVLQIPFKRKTYYLNFAQSWDELSTRQLLQLLPLLPGWRKAYFAFTASTQLNRAAADVVLQKYRLKVLLILLDLRWWEIPIKRAFYSLYPDEVADVLECTNLLLEAPQRKTLPFKSLKVAGHTCVGPAANLSNFTGEEFHFAWLAYHRYSAALRAGEPTADHLNTLCAVLYRPRGNSKKHNPGAPEFAGDARVPFVRFALETNAARWQKVDPAKKKLIAWWFGQIYTQIQKAHPDIFSTKNEGKANSLGWLPIFRSLSQTFLEYNEVAKQSIGMIFLELKDVKRKAQEAERRKMRK
jgi:hypothetical protein